MFFNLGKMPVIFYRFSAYCTVKLSLYRFWEYLKEEEKLLKYNVLERN